MHDAFQVSESPVVSGIQDRVESLLLYGELRSLQAAQTANKQPV
jgi:hypothetical protein